jgi:hypothetical protein
MVELESKSLKVQPRLSIFMVFIFNVGMYSVALDDVNEGLLLDEKFAPLYHAKGIIYQQQGSSSYREGFRNSVPSSVFQCNV